MSYKRGEVYFVDLNPPKGSEIAKDRPGVIISNDIINEHASVIVVCPITDSYGKKSPFHILLEKGEAGLKKESVVHCAQIRAIDKSRVGRKSGVLSEAKVKEIEKGICIALAIEKL